MQKRAIQDWRIRKQILDEQKVVIIPKMWDCEKNFWLNYAEKVCGYKPIFSVNKEEKLDHYKFHNNACLFYSGGLESALIAHQQPELPKINIKDHFEWTNPIEGSLAICGAGLGYKVTTYGGELYDGGNFKEEEKLVGWEYELTVEFAREWEKYSDAIFQSPFWLIEKNYLFKVAIREGVTFNSCGSNKGDLSYWCGKCDKCKQIRQYCYANNIKDITKL